MVLPCWRLERMPHWQGRETAVFVGPDGKPLTAEWINRELKALVAVAGIHKPLTTHVLRKSIATIIGRTNPKYAHMQLGITSRVFEQHPIWGPAVFGPRGFSMRAPGFEPRRPVGFSPSWGPGVGGRRLARRSSPQRPETSDSGLVPHRGSAPCRRARRTRPSGPASAATGERC